MKATCLILASSLFLLGCKGKTQSTTTAALATPTSPQLSKVLATAPTGPAAAIHTLRVSAKPGDEVTLAGRIMGNLNPFVDGRAIFILGDPSILTPCDEVPGDSCTTPWDTCCDLPEDKKRATASIQVVDAAGHVLKEGIKGVGGLVELAHVTVTGVVANGSTPELLIVNATAIRTGQSPNL